MMPLSAMMAGVIVWLLCRNTEIEDRALLQRFVLILAVCMLAFWQTSQTDTVRMQIDPQYRVQTELDAQPVYAVLKDLASDDSKKLHNFLTMQLEKGATLPEAFLQARSLLTQLANERLGFTDQKTRIAWGSVMVDSLRELQAVDAEQCYRALSSQALNETTLAHTFSAANAAAFQEALVAVYMSANQGMRHDIRPGEQPVEFNDAAREFRVIRDMIEEKFSKPVADVIAKKTFKKPFSELPPEPAAQLCAARIAQLDAMLERPQGMAAMLIDSVLR
jgi:hypothetical protein